MVIVDMAVKAGLVDVKTSNEGGLPVEDVVDLALKRMIDVSNEAPAPIRDQAHAFRENLRDILTFYIKMGIAQDRATLCHRLRNAGQSELAEHLRSL